MERGKPNSMTSVSGCGGIGRRTGFRYQRSNPWGFESLHPHQCIVLSERREVRSLLLSVA